MGMRLVVLCLVTALLAGCAAGINAPPINGVEDFERGEVDAAGTAYVAGTPVPPGGFGQNPPMFGCCETAFAANPPGRRLRASNGSYTLPGGNMASQFEIAFQIPVTFDCQRVAGQTCRGTFNTISATTQALIRPQGGGAPIGPTSHRIWWNEAVAPCDGMSKSSDLTILYVARYADRGVPAPQAGQNQTLVLEFQAPRGGAGKKGTDYRLTIELTQLNLNRPLQAQRRNWEALP